MGKMVRTSSIKKTDTTKLLPTIILYESLSLKWERPPLKPVSFASGQSEIRKDIFLNLLLLLSTASVI
jgi:hypothetical protein